MINEKIMNIVVNLENILKIDSSDMKLPFEDIYKNVCFRISRNYGMSIDKDSFDYSADTATTEFRTAIELGNTSLAVYYSMMTIYGDQDFVTLADIKYCGFSKESMSQLMLYLSIDKNVRDVATEVKKVENKIHLIQEINTAKRIMIILCIAYELKIWLMVNLIASILWLGDKKINQNV